jgi:hypothetical protein
MDCVLASLLAMTGRVISKRTSVFSIALTHPSTSSLRKQGPILPVAGLKRAVQPLRPTTMPLWLWVPAFARTTQGKARCCPNDVAAGSDPDALFQGAVEPLAQLGKPEILDHAKALAA